MEEPSFANQAQSFQRSYHHSYACAAGAAFSGWFIKTRFGSGDAKELAGIQVRSDSVTEKYDEIVKMTLSFWYTKRTLRCWKSSAKNLT